MSDYLAALLPNGDSRMIIKKKQWVFIVLVTLLLVAIGSVTYGLISSDSSPKPSQSDGVSSSPMQNDVLPDDTTPVTGEAITATGVVGCLEPKDKTGVHDMSCAVGIKQDDGTSYALSHQDPSVTGSLPTGQRVKVTGTLTKQASTYDIVGAIKVSSIERL